MEQHAIPRQITTFEFKLIGFLTLKQFIYLIIFFPIGYIVFRVLPIPLLNVLFGLIIAGIGVVLAFVPINDRPMEVWIRNFIKRLTGPTQYFFRKGNQPISFLSNLYFVSDPHRVMTHIESQEKLAVYLAKTSPQTQTNNHKNAINTLLEKTTATLSGAKKNQGEQLLQKTTKMTEAKLTASSGGRPAFFTGVVKNHKLIPLPGILVYVKDGQGQTVRLLKTNPHGVFATFNPLLPTEYVFEIKDPNNNYFFDTMKINVEKQNLKPLEVYSKEMI